MCRNDEELNKLMAGVTIAQGGVLPNIQVSWILHLIRCISHNLFRASIVDQSNFSHAPIYLYKLKLFSVQAVLLPKKSQSGKATSQSQEI